MGHRAPRLGRRDLRRHRRGEDMGQARRQGAHKPLLLGDQRERAVGRAHQEGHRGDGKGPRGARPGQAARHREVPQGIPQAVHRWREGDLGRVRPRGVGPGAEGEGLLRDHDLEGHGREGGARGLRSQGPVREGVRDLRVPGRVRGDEDAPGCVDTRQACHRLPPRPARVRGEGLARASGSIRTA